MEIGNTLPLWSTVPFIGMLLSIAVLPLVRAEWWEEHQLQTAIFWSLLFVIPFTIAYGMGTLTYELIESIVLDYIPFIALLLALFIVAGGIAVKGDIAGTPRNNLFLLLIGTLLSSWIGTTGAAMLLIRPLLRANAWRKRKAHVVVFFIFLVANIGGALTPLGDPPLFLGYLRGVPFFWTLKLAPILLFNVVLLSLVFLLIDRRLYNREIAEGRGPEEAQEGKKKEPVRVEGLLNLVWLAFVILGVILNGAMANMDIFLKPDGQIYGFYIFEDIYIGINYFVQLIFLGIAMAGSLLTSKQEHRIHNDFNFGPIAEVARLFIGIFITMIPALALLRANGASLGVDQQWEFFWITGALSSFLDNSPTYVVFLTAAGSLGATSGIVTSVGTLAPQLLLAVSAGAVFMGANTYIGNAPNFMVKSIAEQSGVKMPSFFGYMGWSLVILVPTFLLDTLIFFI